MAVRVTLCTVLAAGLAVAAVVTPTASAFAPASTITEVPAGVSAATNGTANPQEIAAGPDGNVWFTDGDSSVYRATLNGMITPFQVNEEGVAPNDIIAGQGVLWFTQGSGGNTNNGGFPASIGCITTAGAVSQFLVPSSATAAPGLDGITFGNDGNLWFTEVGLNQIGRLVPSPSAPCGWSNFFNEYPLPAGNVLGQTGGGNAETAADSLTSAAGDLYFTEPGANAIGIMYEGPTLPGTHFVGQVRIPGAAPLGITQVGGKTLWFTEGGGADKIGSIPAGAFPPKVTEYPLPSSISGPWSITADAAGDVWFTDNTGVTCLNPLFGPGQQMGVHAAPTASSNPEGITVAQDGAIWFVESNADKLGRVAPVAGFSSAEFCGALPPAVGLDGIIVLPSNKRPVHRSLKIDILPATGLIYSETIVDVNGKLRATQKSPNGGHISLTIPKGRFTLKVTAITRTGGRIAVSRTYRGS
jgi:virginiamycin B lyase